MSYPGAAHAASRQDGIPLASHSHLHPPPAYGSRGYPPSTRPPDNPYQQQSFAGHKTADGPPPYVHDQGSNSRKSGYGQLDDSVTARSSHPGRCQDFPFVVLFFACMTGIGVMVGLGWDDVYIGLDGQPNIPNQPKLNCNVTYFILILVGSTLGGLIVSLVFLEILKRFAKEMIYAAFFVTIGLWTCTAFAFAYYGVMLGAFIAFVIAGIIALFFYFYRWRIPFTAALLDTAVDLLRRFPSMAGLSFSSVVLTALLSFVWAMAANVTAGYSAAEVQYGAAVFVLFTWFWVSQVCQNVVHVTCAGTVGTWYFAGGEEAMPRNPVASSLKRATTCSLGSICLGSLIIAVIKTIRAVLRAARNSSDNDFVACCIDCILGCIESIVRIFNVYAFTQVALYGKSYCDAAKDTWQLFRSNGIDLLINENLVNTVLSLLAFLAGVCTATATALAAVLVFGMREETWMCVSIIASFSFVVGFVEACILFEVIHSAVAAIIVCFAEHPSTLAQLRPELYAKFSELMGPSIGFDDILGRGGRR